MCHYAHLLAITQAFREPVIRDAIAHWALPSASRGLDAGCGAGQQSLLLAEAVGPQGHITGIDLQAGVLTHARRLVDRSSMGDRLTLTQADIHHLPFDGASFDWAWSVDCVGYAPIEPLPLLREMVRVVRPGGFLAILAWSFEQLLPGYPLLEARLRATTSGQAPFSQCMAPEHHFPRFLGRMRRAGLQDLQVRTLAGSVHAPLSDTLKAGMKALFDMRWPGVESDLSPADRSLYRRLSMPDSADFILDHPDYYAFFTYSMFTGTV